MQNEYQNLVPEKINEIENQCEAYQPVGEPTERYIFDLDDYAGAWFKLTKNYNPNKHHTDT